MRRICSVYWDGGIILGPTTRISGQKSTRAIKQSLTFIFLARSAAFAAASWACWVISAVRCFWYCKAAEILGLQTSVGKNRSVQVSANNKTGLQYEKDKENEADRQANRKAPTSVQATALPHRILQRNTDIFKSTLVNNGRQQTFQNKHKQNTLAEPSRKHSSF